MIKFRKLKRHNNRSLTFTELGFGTAPLGNLYKSISDDEGGESVDDLLEHFAAPRLDPLRQH